MNKKGFTLIELLAIIVILAVIALIATPIILGVIDKAKQGSAEQSANGYINAIENQVVTSQLKKIYLIVDGVHSVEELDKLGVEVKGKKPDKGNVVIEKGIVTNYTLGIGEYVVTDGLTEKVTNTKKYENGTAVYYNPVTGEKCESSDAISTTGTKIGCMKWYIFNDAEGLSMVNIILDHNTTPKIVWNSDNKNVSYEESKLKSETDKLVSESKWESIPRLITAEEINEIIGKTEWTNTSNWYCLDSKKADNTNWCAKTKDTSTYKWLFDYTNDCEKYGCSYNDTATYGYWTSTIYGKVNSGPFVWRVSRSGDLGGSYANYDYGIRPVITISKTLISE